LTLSGFMSSGPSDFAGTNPALHRINFQQPERFRLPETDATDAAATQPDPSDGQAAARPPRLTVRDIFVGADGIRAGWSVVLFFALFLTLTFATGFIVSTLRSLRPAAKAITQSQPDASMAPGYVFRHEGTPFVGVLLATWLMGKIERRRMSDYGFSRQRRMQNFCIGLAWGVALLSLLVALLRATGLLVFDARLLSGSSVLDYGAIWLGNFLVVALLEELLSRGYLQFTLTRGLSGLYRFLLGPERANLLGFWTAALALSFAFGYTHKANPGESPLGLLSAGLAGFLFCLSLWRTGSLWWAIGFHTSWDWAQSFLYGVADSGLMAKGRLFATHPVGRPYLSGGLTGPEGSLLLLPVMACGVAVILLTLPRTNLGYPPAGAAQPVAALDLP
jgi:membrane protease YdiL (CAAX protease family)